MRRTIEPEIALFEEREDRPLRNQERFFNRNEKALSTVQLGVIHGRRINKQQRTGQKAECKEVALTACERGYVAISVLCIFVC